MLDIAHGPNMIAWLAPHKEQSGVDTERQAGNPPPADNSKTTTIINNNRFDLHSSVGLNVFIV